MHIYHISIFIEDEMRRLRLFYFSFANASKQVSKTKRWEFNDFHLCAYSEPVVTLCPTQNQTYYLLCQIPPNGPKPPSPLPPNPSCPFRCSNDPNID